MLRRENLESVGMLVIAAQFSPLTIWAANRAEIGFPDGLLLWTLLVATAGSILWWVLRRRGLASAGASAVAFWAVLGVSMLGLLEGSTPGGPVTLVLLLSVFCILVYRLHRFRPFRWFQYWAILFVALSPATFAIQSYLTTAGQASPDEFKGAEVVFRDHPDVILVVFDAHASLDVLESHFGVEVDQQYASWTSPGTTVVRDMRVNYMLTHLSLGSVLEMGYPYGDGDRVREGDWDHLLGTISGKNRLVEAFKGQGYRYTMVESGWSGFHCTAVVDSCVKGIFPDQGTRLAMQRSVLGSAFEWMLSDAESAGTLHSINWLDEGLPTLLGNDEADLVLVHLMLPHPPLRVDAGCRYRMEPGLGGTTVASPWFTKDEVEKRVAGYLDATRCARDVITHLLEVTDENGVLVAFGDHGPDSRAQLFRSPEEWSADDVDERLGALFVTNSGCPTDGLQSLVNLGRWLIGCLAHEQPNYVEDRFFLGGYAQRNVGVNPDPLLEITTDLDLAGSS